MTRKFLIGLGLEEEQIEKIMQANGAAVQQEKIKGEENLESLEKKLNVQIETLNKELKDAPDLTGEVDKLKKELEETKTSFTTEKETLQKQIEDYKSRETSSKVKNSVQDLLAKSEGELKILPDVIPVVLETFDVSLAKFDKEGKLSNSDEIIKGIQEKYPTLFKPIEQKGGVSKVIPPDSNVKIYSKEAIEKMPPKEINENWELVAESLANFK